MSAAVNPTRQISGLKGQITFWRRKCEEYRVALSDAEFKLAKQRGYTVEIASPEAKSLLKDLAKIQELEKELFDSKAKLASAQAYVRILEMATKEMMEKCIHVRWLNLGLFHVGIRFK